MLEVIFVSVISSLGLGLSLFFGFIYLRSKKVSNIILGTLLILLALRILKSVFYNFIDLPIYIKNLGLAANLAVGPLLYLYGLSLLKTFKKVKYGFYLHFLPSLLYLIFSTVIPNAKDNLIWYYAYSIILTQSFIYIVFSTYVYLTYLSSYDKKIKAWYLKLIVVLGSVWMIYTLIFIGLIPIYAAGPISYSILIFFLTYIMFNRQDILSLNGVEKYHYSKVSFDQGIDYLKALDLIIKKEKLYLKPDLSLENLAGKINLPSREVSQIINRHSNKNFSNFINNYRIEEAKKLLETDKKRSKIISIALDSGFKNLSTFNITFKAITKQTPSEYRAKFH